MPRSLLTKVNVALVAVVLGGGLAAAAVRGGGSTRVATRSTTTLAPTTTVAPTTSVAPTTAAPTTTSPPDTAQARAIEQIRVEVAQLRQLPWKATLDVRIVAGDEFVRRLNQAETRDEHPDRMSADGTTFQLLQLLPKGLDLTKAFHDLLDSQVVGFYDPKTKQLVVRSTGSGLDPETRVTIAHEMDHALTDQHFDFGTATQKLDDADKQEEGSAFTGLIEGDAVTLQTLFAQRYLTAKERAQLGGGGNPAVLSRTPKFILDSLRFPYNAGLDFVLSRYRAGGGWQGVNDAYGRPPVSTEQILHPDLYAAAQGWAPPPFPNLASATGCAPVRTTTLGEFGMEELLGEHLDASSASQDATGWNGDQLASVRCGQALGLADRWVADDDASTRRLASALTSWVGAWSGSNQAPGPDGRFSGPKGSGRLSVRGVAIDLVLADDAATADRVSAALG